MKISQLSYQKFSKPVSGIGPVGPIKICFMEISAYASEKNL